MPTASPQQGFSWTLTVDDGSSGAAQPFAFPVSFSIPSGDVGKVDISYMGQANKVKQYKGGMIEPGECTMRTRYCKADYERLYALRGVTHNWVATAATDGVGTVTATFSGYVMSYPVQVDGLEDKTVDIEVKIQVSGDIVIS